MKKIASWIIRIGISVGVLFFMLYTFRDGAKNVLISMTAISPSIFFQALLLYFLVNTLMSLRLQCLFQGQDIFLGKRECLRLTLIGAFFNNFMPTGAGGDLMKGYLAAKRTQQIARSAITILMDRLTGLVVLVLLASLSGLVLANGSIRVPSVVLKVSYFLMLPMALVILLFSVPSLYAIFSNWTQSISSTKIKSYLERALEIVNLYRQKKHILLKALFISFLTQLLFAVVIHILSDGLGVQLPVFQLLVILPLIHIASMIPSINGLGVREGTLVYLLKETMGAEKALALALLSTGILIFWSLVVGGVLYLVFLWGGMRHDSKGVA